MEQTKLFPFITLNNVLLSCCRLFPSLQAEYSAAIRDLTS